MERFEGVDIIFTMREIYKAYSLGKIRFDTNSELRMQDAALSQDPELRQLLIKLVPTGIECCRAWDVMRAGTVEHNEWVKHLGKTECMVSAYAVVPNNPPGQMLFGNIYALNYEKHAQRVLRNAVPMEAEVVSTMQMAVAFAWPRQRPNNLYQPMKSSGSPRSIPKMPFAQLLGWR